MTLHHRTFGDPASPPLVILHGMLGSSRNWQTAGRALSTRYYVHALDLPNHGDSPHTADSSIVDLATAVSEWTRDHGVRTMTLMGHSLGGKVAMRMACDEAGRIDRLLVLDVAPKRYEPKHDTLDAMLAVDLAEVTTRADAEAQLEVRVPDAATRLFLLTNLERTDDGFVWRIPLEVIRANLEDWTAAPLGPEDVYRGPTRFIAGGRSRYVSQADLGLIRRHFPAADLVVLPEAGHNVHVEGGDAFVEAVLGAGMGA